MGSRDGQPRWGLRYARRQCVTRHRSWPTPTPSLLLTLPYSSISSIMRWSPPLPTCMQAADQAMHSGAKRAALHHLPNPYSKRRSSTGSPTMQGQPQQQLAAAPHASFPPPQLLSVKLEPGMHIAAPGAGLLSTTATTHIKQQHTPERQAAAAAAAARWAAGVQLTMKDVLDGLRASSGPAASSAAAAHLETWAVLLGFANSDTFSSMPVVLLLSELATVLDRVKAELACTGHVQAADGCLLALQQVLYLPAVQAEVGQAQLARLQAHLTAASGEVRATAAAAAAAPVPAAATATAAAAAARHATLAAAMASHRCNVQAISDSAAAGAGAAANGSGPQEPPEPAGLSLTQLEEHLRTELHHNQPDLVARSMLALQCIAELSGDTSSSDHQQVAALIRQWPLMLQHLETETKLARVAPAAASLCCTHLANVLTLPAVRSTFSSQNEVAGIHAQVVAASRKYKQAAGHGGGQTEGKPSSSTATARTAAVPAAPQAAVPAPAAAPAPAVAPAAAPPAAPQPMSVAALVDKLRAMGRTDAEVVSRLLRTIASLVSGGDGSSAAAYADAVGSQAVAPLLLEMTALVPYLQQRIANGEVNARTSSKYMKHLLNLLEVPTAVEQLEQQQLDALRQQVAAAHSEFNAASSTKPTQLQSLPAPGSGCPSTPRPEATSAAAALLPESLWSTLPLQKVQKLARTLALLAQLVADDAAPAATSPAGRSGPVSPATSLAKLLRQWRLLHAAAATVPDEGCVHMESLLHLLGTSEVQNELASEHEAQQMLQQMTVAKEHLDRAAGGAGISRPLSRAPSTAAAAAAAAAAAGDAMVERQQESAGTHSDAAAAVRGKAAAGAGAKAPPAGQGSGTAAASGLKFESSDAAAYAWPGLGPPQAPGVAAATPMLAPPPALAAPPRPSFAAAERFLLRRFAQPPLAALGKPSVTELMTFRDAMRLLPTLDAEDSRVVCFWRDYEFVAMFAAAEDGAEECAATIRELVAAVLA